VHENTPPEAEPAEQECGGGGLLRVKSEKSKLWLVPRTSAPGREKFGLAWLAGERRIINLGRRKLREHWEEDVTKPRQGEKMNGEGTLLQQNGEGDY
jgi:hypothetical protein